jgi:hypothetical protein
MKRKKANFIVDLKVYPFHVMFSFTQTDDELLKCLKKYNIDTRGDSWKLEKTVRGRCVSFKDNQTLIRLRNYPKTTEDFGVLAHEIFHAVSFIMYKVGMKLKIDCSDEAYAYLIGFLTEECLTKLNEI